MSIDINELVQSIAAEVLKQLKPEAQKPCVLVLAERDCLVAEKVSSMVGDEYEYYFFGEDHHCKEFCRYIVPSLCVCEMSDLAVGKAHGMIMTEVLRLLLLGNKVEVLSFGYEDYNQTAPGPLYALYQKHEETLKGFGLERFQPKAPESLKFRESLITEKVVSDAAGRGAKELVVLSAAMLTPLAEEAAKELNINISKSL
ncbi:hypothetical protein [Maridesulfovibrio sp.]|uniref:hypothetical protein n=1 Tax=Maridesulfovibrio sp. TaxID=2795000 RepID=UPI0029F4E0E6|nr:hypothetical protein [Maridesulfovibrio sp.]